MKLKELQPGMKFKLGKGKAVYTLDWVQISNFGYDTWYDSHKDYVTYKGSILLHVLEQKQPLKIDIHDHVTDLGDAPKDKDSVEHYVRGYAFQTDIDDVHIIKEYDIKNITLTDIAKAFNTILNNPCVKLFIEDSSDSKHLHIKQTEMYSTEYDCGEVVIYDIPDEVYDVFKAIGLKEVPSSDLQI